MLGITRLRNNRSAEEQTRSTYRTKVDDQNALSDTLESALSSVFRTSLILSQVDSRLEALRQELHTPIPVEQNTISTKNDSLIADITKSSAEHAEITNWLTTLDTDDIKPLNASGWQSSDNLLDDILSSYEESVTSTDIDYQTLPETPVSMQSSYSKLPSTFSNYSMDSTKSNQPNDSLPQELQDEKCSSQKPFAGRNGSVRLHKKAEDRLSNSAITESKEPSISFRRRVRSFSLGKTKWRKSNQESQGVKTTPAVDNTSRVNYVSDDETSNCMTGSIIGNSTRQSDRKFARFQHRRKIDDATATETPLIQHSLAIDIKEPEPNDMKMVPLPIPYSLPKECDIDSFGNITIHNHNNGVLMCSMPDKQPSTYLESACDQDNFSEPEVDTEMHYTLTDASHIMLSNSWTASNVFEYYFSPEVRSETHTLMHESAYRWVHKQSIRCEKTIDRRNMGCCYGKVSIENEYRVQHETRQGTSLLLEGTANATDSSNQSHLQHRIYFDSKPEDGEKQNYPTEIVGAYFRIDEQHG
ncbi:hypothetical protein Unana1_07063 [Umbelopsis nana]